MSKGIKIDFISDTHQFHQSLTLPGGDILVCAGDMLSRRRDGGFAEEELQSTLDWLGAQRYKHKVFIAGNHCDLLEYYYEMTGVLNIFNDFDFHGVHYLMDSSVIIEGIKFYGSPWQPEFLNWSFNLPRNGYKLEARWNAIPDDTDILITHGPAFGTLDTTKSGRHEGCELLAERLDGLPNLRIHAFGHIHDSFGYKQHSSGLQSINASMMAWTEEKSLNYPISVTL